MPAGKYQHQNSQESNANSTEHNTFICKQVFLSLILKNAFFSQLLMNTLMPQYTVLHQVVKQTHTS
jgi:hypothetical protein